MEKDQTGIFVGQGETPFYLLLSVANRHGLIAGATGTGKTITLQILAEGFSSHGVPVFLADIKGDLAGISQPGEATNKIMERVHALGMENFSFRSFPSVFWDLFGKQGHQMRTTISDMGPLLLANLLELNEAQEGILNIAFKLADEQGLLLLDFKDLRALLTSIGDKAQNFTLEYGHVTAASVGAILRRLLILEQQGGENFFGEPALDLTDLMRIDFSGFGAISILAADKLMQSPKLYAGFLLWLLAELFEQLPEVGDAEKPKMVFFFDEAHLLFDHAPKALVDKIEQVVRLIRSKAVGVYFVTQNPLDIPESILGQLGNRIQHALRAFTSKQQKDARAAAETMPSNPAFNGKQLIMELAVGEALVSLLDEKGRPGMAQRVNIRPPSSRLGQITAVERQAVMAKSPVQGKYDKTIDRESAYEMLIARNKEEAITGDFEVASGGRKESAPSRGRPRQSFGESMAKDIARTFGGQLGRQIARGILSIFKTK